MLFYRLESERRQHDAALQQAPQFKLQILTQEVKFYGHFLETVGRLKNEAGFKPSKEQQLAVNKAKVLLDAAVKGLEGIKGVLDDERHQAVEPAGVPRSDRGLLPRSEWVESMVVRLAV